MKKLAVLAVVLVLPLIFGACNFFQKITYQSPPPEDISQIIEREQGKMMEEVRKNEIKAEKENEFAAKAEEERMQVKKASIKEFLHQIEVEIEKMPLEKLFKNNRPFYSEDVGFDREKTIFAILLILPAEPKNIEGIWLLPKAKRISEFTNGIYTRGKIVHEKYFAYLIIADLDEVGIDQFFLVIKYNHPISKRDLVLFSFVDKS